MEKPNRPARTNTFEHTISGLLTKRADLYNEAERIRDRLGEIRNGIGAIDRTLSLFGYEGDPDTVMRRERQNRIFGRGELARAIADILRTADGPLSKRDIARRIIEARGEDADDMKYLASMAERVKRAMQTMREAGKVQCVADAEGNAGWERRA